MKRLFPIILTLIMSAPVLAGDVSVPGKQDPPPPPPCTENCTSSTTAILEDLVSIEDLLLELLILAIVKV